MPTVITQSQNPNFIEETVIDNTLEKVALVDKWEGHEEEQQFPGIPSKNGSEMSKKCFRLIFSCNWVFSFHTSLWTR